MNVFQHTILTCSTVIVILWTLPSGINGLQCFVCKNPAGNFGYDRPISCPNVNNPATTVKQDCPSGVCLTFRGSQRLGAEAIEDGVVRLCSTGSTIPTIFGTGGVTADSGDSCGRQVSYSSSSSSSSGVQRSLTITGQVCTCTTHLCNSQFQTGAGASSRSSSNTVILWPVLCGLVRLIVLLF